MSAKQLSSLLLCCGALHDISEECEYVVEASNSLNEVKRRSRQISEHIKNIQLKIEKIVIKKINPTQ